MKAFNRQPFILLAFVLFTCCTNNKARITLDCNDDTNSLESIDIFLLNHYGDTLSFDKDVLESTNKNCRIIIGSFFNRVQSNSSGDLMQYISNEEQQDKLLRIP